MDPIQYLQQCAQEDQDRLDAIVPIPPGRPSSLDATPRFDDYMLGESRQVPARSFNISTRLLWGCALPSCGKAVASTTCTLCKSVSYCSDEHCRADRPGRHRSVCAKIRKAQTHYRKETNLIRTRIGSTILDEGIGQFWRVDSRQYTRARLALVEALLASNTAQAVALSLDNLLGLLRLNRSDPFGVRDVIPVLYTRFGYDQEAYDFCHWWATTGHGDEYDWHDYRGPYLDTRNADVFENFDVFCVHGMHFSHIVVITLLKIRLLIKLHSVQRAREIAGPYVPQEILDVIQLHCIGSLAPVVSKVVEQEKETQYMTLLREQIQHLYGTVAKANSHFWPALIDPGDNLLLRPTTYEQGGTGQMQVVLQNNFNAWSETPGAIGIIEELSRSRSHVG